MELIAKHEIIRGAGAKRETIAPKEHFTATGDEAAELIAAGAAFEVEDEKKPAKKAKKGDAESDDAVI